MEFLCGHSLRIDPGRAGVGGRTGNDFEEFDLKARKIW